jgi:hypothetical protein
MCISWRGFRADGRRHSSTVPSLVEDTHCYHFFERGNISGTEMNAATPEGRGPTTDSESMDDVQHSHNREQLVPGDSTNQITRFAQISKMYVRKIPEW